MNIQPKPPQIIPLTPLVSLRLLLSSYYFIYCSWIALVLGFVPLYWDTIGFGSGQIGTLTSIFSLTSMIGAPIMVALSERFSKSRIVLISNLLTLALISLLMLQSRFVVVALLWFSIHFCNKHQALVDIAALNPKLMGKLTFEKVRVWGSIGFVVMAPIVGMVVDHFGSASVLVIAILYFFILTGNALLLSSFLNSGNISHSKNRSIRRLKHLTNGRFLCLLFSSFCGQAAHGPLYIFLSLYLESLHWSGFEISLAWNTGVGCEVLFFLIFANLAQKFTMAQILTTSLLLSILRWGSLLNYSNPVIIFIAQGLHAFSFGGLYLSSIRMVGQLLPENEHGFGLATLQATSLGMGTVLGMLIATYLASGTLDYSGIAWVFKISMLFAISGFLTSIYLLGRRHQVVIHK